MRGVNYVLTLFPLQRLEDQHLNGDRQSGRSPGTVPGKIRDIVTKSISPGDPKMASTSPLGDENRMLNSEVSRLEDLLAATRAERDEIGSKYMAVSERVSWLWRVEIFKAFCTLTTKRGSVFVTLSPQAVRCFHSRNLDKRSRENDLNTLLHKIIPSKTVLLKMAVFVCFSVLFCGGKRCRLPQAQFSDYSVEWQINVGNKREI